MDMSINGHLTTIMPALNLVPSEALEPELATDPEPEPEPELELRLTRVPDFPNPNCPGHIHTNLIAHFPTGSAANILTAPPIVTQWIDTVAPSWKTAVTVRTPRCYVAKIG